MRLSRKRPETWQHAFAEMDARLDELERGIGRVRRGLNGLRRDQLPGPSVATATRQTGVQDESRASQDLYTV